MGVICLLAEKVQFAAINENYNFHKGDGVKGVVGTGITVLQYVIRVHFCYLKGLF